MDLLVVVIDVSAPAHSTLADLTFAVTAQVEGRYASTIQSTMRYLHHALIGQQKPLVLLPVAYWNAHLLYLVLASGNLIVGASELKR